MLAKISVVIFCAAMGLCLFPAHSAGQGTEESEGRGETGCGNELYCYDPDEHKVPGPGSEYASDPYRIHNDCIICWVGNEPGGASDCHDECEGNEEDEDYQVAYRDLRRAMEDLNVREVLNLSAVVTKHAALNLDRRSIQILGCDGVRLIGNIPLSDDEMALATALVPVSIPKPVTDVKEG